MSQFEVIDDGVAVITNSVESTGAVDGCTDNIETVNFNNLEKLKEKYTLVFDSIVKEQIKIKTDTIFVLAGISPYINLESYKYHITDIDTFDKEGGKDIFEEDDWADSVYFKLRNSRRFQILSYQQYVYINEYFPKRIPVERVAIIYDNLRQIFPMLNEDYAKYNDDKPVYMAELFEFSGISYYSLCNFIDNINKIPFFTTKKDLLESYDNSQSDVLDINSDCYAIDKFVNQNLKIGSFDRKIAIDISEVSKVVFEKLKVLNEVLSHFGGEVLSMQNEEFQEEYIPKEEILALLKKYWGDDAVFNTIEMYKNPLISNEIINISQGEIVETIIDEYEKARNDENYRDVFITAPTGSGKSLIFQIPAFYASDKGGITIIISPLKALMKDQVDNLLERRNYNKVGFVNSDLSFAEKTAIIQKCKNGEIDILYLSPELLLLYDIQYFIGERKLGLLVIDEAHLITTWGRNFRVDYWNLGTYIKVLRKYQKFPVVALTATAVIGGENDMVFDTIDSLSMSHPYKFIGKVRRDNIEFVINSKNNCEKDKKIKETCEFITEINELGAKTLIYAPLRKHVNSIYEQQEGIVAKYHGKMSAEEQNYSYDCFKNNNLKIMVATKAFGMGIDIPDIQLVYHHAPSGLVADYVQEIGRVARDKKKNIQGYAALNFSESDLYYSDMLFSLSSIKKFQLKEVMRKIIRNYNKNEQNRNILIAIEDFAYIFDPRHNMNQDEDNSGVFNKVASALRMIEDDYVKKGFEVLTIEPKTKNTKVYARLDNENIRKLGGYFNENSSEYYKEVSTGIVELDLDNIWKKCYDREKFSYVRNLFYKGELLKKRCGFDIKPVVKISITIEKEYYITKNILSCVVGIVCKFIKNKKAQEFTKDEFVKYLSSEAKGYGFDSEKIAAFILDVYSKSYYDDCRVYIWDKNEDKYGISQNNHYSSILDELIGKFDELYKDKDGEQCVTKFVPIQNSNYYINLCSLLETMNLGSFETNGGKDPKISLILHNPERFKRDSVDFNYSNKILESIEERHKISCEFFKKFFGKYYTNGDRWNMIEDFFLGKSNDEIFYKYQVKKDVDVVDVIEHLKENKDKLNVCEATVSENKEGISDSLPRLQRGRTYNFTDNLTINNEKNTIDGWIRNSPEILHKYIKNNGISIGKREYKTLMSKLEHNCFDYYRDIMGLNLIIKFNENDEPIQARIFYQSEPVKFYKWWRNNQNKVHMESHELIALFGSVYDKDKRALLKKHKEMLDKVKI